MANKKESIIEILKTPTKEEGFQGTKWISYIIGDMAHSEQFRDNGHSYFSHPKHLVDMFYELVSIGGWTCSSVLEENKIPNGVVELAYLHDVVEDTELTHQDIKDIFRELGFEDFFDDYLDEPLKLITHDKSEDYDTYIEKVMKHPASSLVKMLDLADNMNLLGLGKLDDKEIDRVIRYAHYFKRINDKYHFLEKLKKSFKESIDAWDN